MQVVLCLFIIPLHYTFQHAVVMYETKIDKAKKRLELGYKSYFHYKCVYRRNKENISHNPTPIQRSGIITF